MNIASVDLNFFSKFILEISKDMPFFYGLFSILFAVSLGIAAAFINPYTEISKVLVMANISWKPNDNEMQNVDFEDYDWNKWNK